MQEKNFLKRLIGLEEINIFIALLVLFGIGTIFSKNLITWGNLSIIFSRMSIWGILAIGATLVILIGEFDISVGAMVSFGSMFFATILRAGIPLLPAIILLFVLTFTLETINAFVVVKLKISSFIATIAMLYICQAAARLLTGARPVSIFNIEGTQILIDFARINLRGLGISFFIFIFLIIITQIALKKTIYGRKIYATGDNIKVAKLSGINTDLIRMSTFIISGFMVGLSSMLTVGRETAGNPNYGVGWELIVIAAVVIGGTSITGGSGSMIGTFIGVTIIAAISNILVLLNVDQNMQSIVTGIIIIMAVVLDVRRKGKKLGKLR